MEKKKISEIQVEDIMNRKWIPYAIFLACTIFLHVFGYEYYGDDSAVVYMLRDSIWEELLAFVEILEGWSSRFLINPLIHIVLHFDYKVWLVLDVLCFATIYEIVKRRYVETNSVPMLYVLTSVMCILPYKDFSEVGWAVTTITYIWVATAGIISLVSIKRIFQDEKIEWYMGLGYMFLTLFATNKEEVSVMFVIMFLVALIVAIKENKKYALLVVQFIISLAGMFGHMFSSNNAGRYERRIVLTAQDNTFFDKVVIGISSTLRYVVFEKNFLFICFNIVLIIVTWFACKKILPRLVCFIPIILCSMTWVPGEIDYMFGTNVTGGPRVIAVIILGVIAVLAIFYCITQIYGLNYKCLALITALGAGFAGRCVVGFANSGWQAYERTYTFLCLTIIIITCIMVCDIWKSLSYRKKQILFGVIIVMGQLGFAKNILDIGII